jgi:hypothetical protein
MANAVLTIDYDFKTCPTNKIETIKAQFVSGGYMNIIILFLSMLKLIFTFKKMYFSLYTLNKIKERLATHEHEDEELESLTTNNSRNNFNF